MKKILFIGSNPKNAGGIETFGRALKDVFGEEIYFYSFYKTLKPLYPVDNVIEIFPYNFLFRGLNKISREKISDYFLNKIISKFEILLINTPSYLNRISKKNKQKKIILVQHQTSKSFLERKDYLNKDNKLLEKMKEEIDRLVTLSPFDTKDFIQKFSLDQQKVSSIRHCSKLEIISFDKQKSKKLITICRLVNKHKRIDLMLEGMKRLPEFELEIWGDGPDKNYLKKKLKDLDLKNVKFMGQTSDIKEKLDLAGIFLMTSDYEGYPIAVIEAIKRGLPIVIRNTFVSSQDLVEGNGVLLDKDWNSVEFEIAIRDIYNDYEKYSEKSIENAKKYEFENFKQEWIKLIENIGKD